MLKLSICLSDIPKEKITTAKNGKKYVSLVVWENREQDKYGTTHSVQMNKENKEEPTKYVGNGVDYDKRKPADQTETPQSSGEHDDLPF